MQIRRWLRWTGGGLLAIATVAAPGAAKDAAPAPRSELTEEILREAQDTRLRRVGVARVRISYPQKLSAAIGAMFAHLPTSYDCTAVCEFRGLLLQAEPGLAGGQLSAGYAVVNGETAGERPFLKKVYLAYGVKAAVLRTWGDSDLSPADQTLLGIEGDLSVIQLNFSLGVFRPVFTSGADDPWIITGGVGWGF